MKTETNSGANEAQNPSLLAITQELQNIETRCSPEVIRAAKAILLKLLVENKLNLGKPYIGLKQNPKKEENILSFFFSINQYMIFIFFQGNKSTFLIENYGIGFKKEGSLHCEKKFEKFANLLRCIQHLQLHPMIVLA
jgi:hypothetical protein